MDTSTSFSRSIREVSVLELKNSDLPEERELAGRITSLVQLAAAELKPILKYVTSPVALIENGQRGFSIQHTRALLLHNSYGSTNGHKTRGAVLFLGEDGNFFTALHSSVTGPNNYDVKRGYSTCEAVWEAFPAQIVLDRLIGAFKEAATKREEFLENIRAYTGRLEERRKQLLTLLALLK